MPSNRSGFTASARWSKPTDFSEHTSLPTEFARFSTVLTTNISLFHRRSPDHALGSLLNAPDPDAPPPRWMESINSMSPPRAFVFGVALFPIQIKNLAIFVACLNLIIASSLGPEGSIVALGLVLMVFAIPILVLIGLYAAVPKRASKMLRSLRAWMDRNNRTITVVLCFVFAAFFLVIGLAGP